MLDFIKYNNQKPLPRKPSMPRVPSLSKHPTEHEVARYQDDLQGHAQEVKQYSKDLLAYEAECAEYFVEEKRLEELFWSDALASIGVHPDHHLVGLLRQKAWEYGHASGYSGVYTHLVILSDFVDPVPEVVTLKFETGAEARHFQYWWNRNKEIFATDYRLEQERYEKHVKAVAAKDTPPRRRTRRVR